MSVQLFLKFGIANCRFMQISGFFKEMFIRCAMMVELCVEYVPPILFGQMLLALITKMGPLKRDKNCPLRGVKLSLNESRVVCMYFMAKLSSVGQFT